MKLIVIRNGEELGSDSTLSPADIYGIQVGDTVTLHFLEGTYKVLGRHIRHQNNTRFLDGQIEHEMELNVTLL